MNNHSGLFFRALQNVRRTFERASTHTALQSSRRTFERAAKHTKNVIFSDRLFIVLILKTIRKKLKLSAEKFDIPNFFEEKAQTFCYQYNRIQENFSVVINNSDKLEQANKLKEQIFTKRHICRINNTIHSAYRLFTNPEKKKIKINYLYKYKKKYINIDLFIGIDITINLRNLCALSGIETGLVFYYEKKYSSDNYQLKYVTSKSGILLKSCEFEVLKYMLQGFTSQEISSFINCSVHTVYSHKKNLYKIFEAKNAYHLIKNAKEKNFI